MRNLNYITYYLILYLFVCLSAHATGVEDIKSQSPENYLVEHKRYLVEYDLTYKYSSSQFYQKGEHLKEPSLDLLEIWNQKFQAGYGLTKDTSLFLQLNYNSIFLSTPHPNLVTDTDRSGISDLNLTLRGAFIKESWGLSFYEFTSVLPFLYSSNPNYELALGNSTYDIGISGHFYFFPIETLSLGGSYGYLYRSHGYSSELPFSLRVDFYFGKNNIYHLYTSAFGNVSNKNDQLNSYQIRENGMPAGSFAFKAINPEGLWTETGASVYFYRNFQIGVSIGTSIFGRNIPNEDRITLSLAFRPGKYISPFEYNEEELENIPEEEIKPITPLGKVINLLHSGKQVLVSIGKKDDIKLDEVFYILNPQSQDKPTTQPKAIGKVVFVGKKTSILKIEKILIENDSPMEGDYIQKTTQFGGEK